MENANLSSGDFWGWKSQFPTRYLMLIFGVIAQVATVMITWQLWQVRSTPPHLPVFDWPQVPFGVLMLVSALYILIDPRRGLIVHCLVITAASLLDQFRLQPQFLAIIILIWAANSDFGLRTCRWFLASLWVWAGIHKLLSVQWFSFGGHWILTALTNNTSIADSFFWHFAFAVAAGEIAVGLLGIFAVRLAAFFCALMHLSIFFLLVIISWNFSVLPWNLATALVGTWVLWKSTPDVESVKKQKRFERPLVYAIAIFLFVAPAGFYWGFVDHGYASVLYSDGIPRGLITKQDHLEYVTGWDPIHVPFPSERRTYLKYFEQVASDGEKLHIFDPRDSLEDQFFVFRNGQAIQIQASEFYAAAPNELAGIGYSDRYALFWLSRWGRISEKFYKGQESESKYDLIAFGYTPNPEHYSPKMLELLKRLPNLEQLQLANCPVSDNDLQIVSHFKRLQFIGLSNTSVTDDGILHLAAIKVLQEIEIENTQISTAGLKKLQQKIQAQ